MADSATEIRNGGKSAATGHLRQVEQIFGPSTSVVCAEGMVEAVVEHITRTDGPRAAFDLLVRFSDAVGATVAAESSKP